MSTQKLIDAVISNDHIKVERMLASKHSPNSYLDHDKITPLHFAAQHNSHESAKLLLLFGANPQLTTSPDGYTALDIAKIHGSYEIIKLLSEYIKPTT